MLEVLREKFKNSHAQKALQDTKNVYLVEHNPVKGRDTFWSDDNDGTGKNMLGTLLMQARAGLFRTSLPAAPSSYRADLPNKIFS